MRNAKRGVRSAKRREAGFATVVAVSMVAMMAVAIAAIMWRFKEGMIDARMESRSAELRQLLIAGAAASHGLISESREELSVPLPASLVDRGAAVVLRLTPPSGDLERFVTVEARLNGITSRQTLRYGRTSAGWALIGAELNPKPPE